MNDFNPCEGGETRFAPIYDDDQNCIPTLYAADSVEAAIYESVLHDDPLVADVKGVRLNTVLTYQLSDLLVLRSLRLASLRAPDLMKWGVRKSALIGSTSAHYKNTGIWAKRIHFLEFRFVTHVVHAAFFSYASGFRTFFGSPIRPLRYRLPITHWPCLCVANPQMSRKYDISFVKIRTSPVRGRISSL